MIKIDNHLLDQISGQAKSVPRQRMNHNFHNHSADPLQRLLNAMEPFSYIQPHKHEDPDKREAFFALRGRILFVEFDDRGNISDHLVLDPLDGIFGAEIPERTFHTLIALDPGSVVYEIKDGPYNPIDDKNFAPWAPKEGEPGAREYLDLILSRIGITGMTLDK
ncbi:MAG: WbuC family cupin fold metalloprotein [Bacteroidota bacterium]